MLKAVVRNDNTIQHVALYGTREYAKEGVVSEDEVPGFDQEDVFTVQAEGTSGYDCTVYKNIEKDRCESS